MNTIDTVCRRLRDIGIFLLGVAAVTLTIHYIYDYVYSPTRQAERLGMRLATESFEKAFAERSNK